MDRAWYDAEEDGNIRYAGLDENWVSEEAAEELALKQKKEMQPISKRTLNSADHEKWEMNRMITSGAVKLRDNATRMEDYVPH
jgi:hypothetical protein